MIEPQYVQTTLAAFLPQYHPIAENDEWWGQGFTEWTHLRRARSWRNGHRVRRPASELGEYNLTHPEALEAQFETASRYGITGFAVWHYWFGNGVKLLEKPLDIVVKNKLRFRYSLSWANHSWFDKSNNRLLMEQLYLGKEDYTNFFFDSLKHFESENYIFLDGRPIFSIFEPRAIPDLDMFMDVWSDLAARAGLPGIFWIGDKISTSDPLAAKFDRVSNGFTFWTNRKKLYINWLKEKLRTKAGISWSPQFYNFDKMLFDAIPEDESKKYIPTIITGWDTTPRHSHRGVVFENYNPSSFKRHLASAYEFIADKKPDHPIFLLKSWNEWAEGNAIEPDEIDGASYLEIYKRFTEKVEELYSQ